MGTIRRRPQGRRAAAAREARQGWLARPHSRLTADQLERAITDAERKRTVNLADAEQARQQHTATEPAVLAGQGPRVTALDASVTELRRVAEVYERAERLNPELWSAQTAGSMCVAQARGKEIQAAATSRFRPGQGDRLLGEAAELYTRAEHAHAEAEVLGQQMAELYEQGYQQGGTSRWWREKVERAETSYPQDREHAQQLDVQELNFTHQRIGWRQTAADKIAAYTAERRLRIDMPPCPRTIEHGLRDAWHHEQQQQIHAERAAEQARHSAEYYRSYQPPTLEQGYDHGLELGM